MRQPRWNHSGKNVLIGLLRCPECGAPMAASNVTNTLRDGTKKKIRCYSCSTFRNKEASACHANSIRADYAEKSVANQLKEIGQVPEVLEHLVKDLNREMENQIKPREQELAVINVEKNDISEKLLKWQEVLEDSP